MGWKAGVRGRRPPRRPSTYRGQGAVGSGGGRRALCGAVIGVHPFKATVDSRTRGSGQGPKLAGRWGLMWRSSGEKRGAESGREDLYF